VAIAGSCMAAVASRQVEHNDDWRRAGAAELLLARVL
jgi:hypothetical protein